MCVCQCLWAESSDNRNYNVTACGQQPPLCVRFCVKLSVTFQDVFISELLGTGHFLRTQKCEGVDQVS